MPPRNTKDTLTESEKAIIKTWIASGAPVVGDHNHGADSGARFITEAEVLKDIASDLASVPAPDRSFMRYFLLTHLANSRSSDSDLRLYRPAFSRLINSLSWVRAVAVPRTVDRAGIPAYNPAHNYTFVLDTGLGAPGRLHFGVGDRGFDDNTGAYTIQLVQLRPLR